MALTPDSTCSQLTSTLGALVMGAHGVEIRQLGSASVRCGELGRVERGFTAQFSGTTAVRL
ncbi:uncharacterized protein N7487_003036 [Penicillium crustosum]|uniref:uncharacterized protein n=1 Tax=Penicillium crustosum TaxID=36656 RepID=UPI00239771DA|nr:uncharacterized protein N7487_003036 [Penicillium crustosum]KAJ5419486.1 hypothetical protein N7487_003036 [Penicillium crustosum]